MTTTTLSFLDFLRLNAPANLAIVFLAGVFVGMFLWNWSKKLFIVAILLAVVLAGSKVKALQSHWPFSSLNTDQISAQAQQAGSKLLIDQATKEAKDAVQKP